MKEKEYYDLKIYLNDEMIMGLRQLTSEELIDRISFMKQSYFYMKMRHYMSPSISLRFEVE